MQVGEQERNECAEPRSISPHFLQEQMHANSFKEYGRAPLSTGFRFGSVAWELQYVDKMAIGRVNCKIVYS